MSDSYSYIHLTRKEALATLLDDIVDFHDPFSPLSLYLAKKIRKKSALESAQSWSIQLQESILKDLAYEFSQKFPRYLLSASAVKKIWVKQIFLTQELKKHPQTFYENGDLNLDVLIRENIQNFHHFYSPYSHHPYYQVQHLALKIAEIAASLEGRRLDVDKLFRKIWLSLRCLIPDTRSTTTRKMEEEADAEDVIIIANIVHSILANPHLSYTARYEKLVSSHENDLERLISFLALGEMIYGFVNVNKNDPDYQAAQAILDAYFLHSEPIIFDSGERRDHFVKVLWYQKAFGPEVSLFERYLLRHGMSKPFDQIIQTCEQCLPFIPTDRTSLCEFFREKNEDNPKNDQRKTKCLRHIQNAAMVG